MEITVIKLSKPMDCMDCFKAKATHGLTRDGVNVFRVTCHKCMRIYADSLSAFLDGKVTEVGNRTEEANNE